MTGPPELCAVCDGPIEDGEPVQTDISGAVSHTACIETLQPEDDEEEQ